MNKKIKILIGLLLIVFAYILNYYLLKIAIFQFTGIVLGLIIILSVIINFAVKIKKRKSPEVGDHSFILPQGVAKKMDKISVGIQYEASILSLTFLIVGMTLFSIYFVFFTGLDWIFKGFYIFNSICGLVLMISMLVTQWQQFNSYRESQGIISSFRDGPDSGGEIVIDFPLPKKSNNHNMKGGSR